MKTQIEKTVTYTIGGIVILVVVFAICYTILQVINGNFNIQATL